MTTALYGQDSYTIKRLNLIGGLRWERVEGYLPAQTRPAEPLLPGRHRCSTASRSAAS